MKKGINVLTDNYKMISEIGRLLYIYGCFSNTDFDDPVIRKRINDSLVNSEKAYRKYMDNWGQILKDILDNESSMPNDKKKYKHISSDKFGNETKVLIKFYRFCCKKNVINPVRNYIYFLSKLSGSNIEDASISKEIKDYFGIDTYKNSLFFMEKQRSRFSDNELFQLYNALMFYSSKAPYSIPGHFACDRINDYLRLSEKENISDVAVPIFEYNNMERFFNDNAVYTIFEAIKRGKKVRFKWRKNELRKLKHMESNAKPKNNSPFLTKDVCVYPLKIMYEFQNGRGWLIAWKNKIRIYRLDDIFKLELCSDTPDKLTVKKANEQLDVAIKKMWLSLSDDKDDKKEHIVIDFDVRAKDMKKVVPIGAVEKTARRKCRFEADMLNYYDIVPFVRRYGEKAHISKTESPKLYQRVKDDLEKALEKYEVKIINEEEPKEYGVI